MFPQRKPERGKSITMKTTITAREFIENMLIVDVMLTGGDLEIIEQLMELYAYAKVREYAAGGKEVEDFNPIKKEQP